jgi:hypothetical protein
MIRSFLKMLRNFLTPSDMWEVMNKQVHLRIIDWQEGFMALSKNYSKYLNVHIFDSMTAAAPATAKIKNTGNVTGT